MKKQINWKKGGIAAALVTTMLAGSLAIGSSAYAQTTNPLAANSVQQGVVGHRGGPRGGFGSYIAIAAKALGMDPAALVAELQAGKTVAEVAQSKNIQLNVVVNAILEYHKAKLALDVQHGVLTQAQADEMLANASTRINTLLTSKLPQRSPKVPGAKQNRTAPGTLPAPTPAPGA